MEVTLVHPDNEDQKVKVTNQIQYDAFKARGFVDVAEDKKKDLKAAQTPSLQAKPEADASKKADLKSDTDKKNEKAEGTK